MKRKCYTEKLGRTWEKQKERNAMRLYLPVFPGQEPSTENTRPAYVVEDIKDLTAQPTGIVTLPLSLNWTPENSYDVSDTWQKQKFYEVILSEAHSENDIKDYINGEELTELWEHLRIPTRVRYAWESVHPRLGLRKYQ
jgi:hypothetical protein